MKPKTLLVGTGNIAFLIMKQIINSHDVCGFIKHNTEKQSLDIEDKLILGVFSNIKFIMNKYEINEIIICLSESTRFVIQEIISVCKNTNVTIKIVSSVCEEQEKNLPIKYNIRKIQIEDLLHRKAINFDMPSIKSTINNKTILVTGAGGSIGSEICYHLSLFQPKCIILLGHGEYSIFKINLRLQKSSCKIKPVIADIRSVKRINDIMKEHKPDIVFHTAAHKHVYFMESHPAEAIDNNIIGTYNVLRSCIENKVARFVFISSDKAVNPSSIMGATKRLAEFLVTHTAQKYNLPYVCVRFGNILNSRGSVVEIFEGQIRNGGPITITHPDIERYFMTISEAVQLVLQAFTLGKKGDIFILDMGKPVKIIDLAKDLLSLHGLSIDDVEIKYIGMRQGEKLQESLNYKKEDCSNTRYEKILHIAHTQVPFENIEKIMQKFIALRDDNNKNNILSFFKHLASLRVVEK